MTPESPRTPDTPGPGHRPPAHRPPGLPRPLRLLGLALWFTRAILVSTVGVLRDLLTPGQSSTPGVVRFATRCRTDLELTLLASMITLTPGTLTLGVAREAGGVRSLVVHGMYAPDAATFREELADMESHLLRAVRREGVGP